MGKMNWKHIIVGGLITALLFSLGFLNAVVFAPGWFGAVEESLGSSWEWNIGGAAAQVLLFAVMGIGLIWLYAAIRPRYGPGPRTAAIAGFVMWLITTARDGSWLAWGFIPAQTLTVSTLVGLPILIGATMLVAWAYTDEEGSTAEPVTGGLDEKSIEW